ncbi:MAG: hypothetical protein FWD60_06835 [Candidatus Azobacteroides sp.]|nr:hypothetical protein [Candidatus Azobacteroides sp.]
MRKKHFYFIRCAYFCNQSENARDYTDYSSNIFGLGRDDDSGLYQKQSHSANDSTMTVFRGDAVTPLNSDNTGTLEDKQFIMVGRNVKYKIPG